MTLRNDRQTAPLRTALGFQASHARRWAASLRRRPKRPQHVVLDVRGQRAIGSVRLRRSRRSGQRWPSAPKLPVTSSEIHDRRQAVWTRFTRSLLKRCRSERSSRASFVKLSSPSRRPPHRRNRIAARSCPMPCFFSQAWQNRWFWSAVRTTWRARRALLAAVGKGKGSPIHRGNMQTGLVPCHAGLPSLNGRFGFARHRHAWHP